MTSQKPYLREISIFYNSTILEYIMRDMQELISLNLIIEHLPGTAAEELFTEKNTNLEVLNIHYNQLFMRTDFLAMLFRHYSNIKSLTLNFHYGGWAFANDDQNEIELANLKHLTINSSSNFVFLKGNFPKLKSLHVHYFRISSVYSFPHIDTLEKLTVNTTSFKISKLALFYRNLKYMKIDDGPGLTEKGMKKLIDRLPKLETMVIKRYMWRVAVTPQEFLTSIGSKLSVVFQNY